MADANDLMGQMEEQKSPVAVTGGMDTTELKEFIEYVVGDVAEPPAVMNKIMNNLIQKLSMGLGYNVVANIGRQAKLAKFLSVAEEFLFDTEDLKDMDKKQIAELHKEAGKTLTDLFEVQRKFIVQNKDVLKTDSTPQEKMVSKLMTLPPDKIEKIMAQIDKEMSGEPEPEKTEELTEEDLAE